LAQRSADAAKEIKTLISTSTQQVEAGVSLVGQTGEALTRIVEQVASIDNLVRDISASASEQATGLNEVNTAVNQMDQVVQQNAAMVEEATAATHSLKNEAKALAEMVARFRVAEGAMATSQAAPRVNYRPGAASRRVGETRSGLVLRRRRGRSRRLGRVLIAFGRHENERAPGSGALLLWPKSSCVCTRRGAALDRVARSRSH
ncbi:MAG: methyl-accepting chemotaxis protein, partial [Allorhizobium sp.]